MELNVILVYHRTLRNHMGVYNRVKDMVNGANSTYRLKDKPYLVEAGDRDQHWGAVEKHFGQYGKKTPDSKCNVLFSSFTSNISANFISLFTLQIYSSLIFRGHPADRAVTLLTVSSRATSEGVDTSPNSSTFPPTIMMHQEI